MKESIRTCSQMQLYLWQYDKKHDNSYFNKVLTIVNLLFSWRCGLLSCHGATTDAWNSSRKKHPAALPTVFISFKQLLSLPRSRVMGYDKTADKLCNENNKDFSGLSNFYVQFPEREAKDVSDLSIIVIPSPWKLAKPLSLHFSLLSSPFILSSQPLSCFDYTGLSYLESVKDQNF